MPAGVALEDAPEGGEARGTVAHGHEAVLARLGAGEACPRAMDAEGCARVDLRQPSHVADEALVVLDGDASTGGADGHPLGDVAQRVVELGRFDGHGRRATVAGDACAEPEDGRGCAHAVLVWRPRVSCRTEGGGAQCVDVATQRARVATEDVVDDARRREAPFMGGVD